MTNQIDKVSIAREVCSTPITDLSPVIFERWLWDDVELHYPGSDPIPFARVWRGRESFPQFLQTFGETVETEDMTFDSFHGDGDNVFITGRTTGRVRATGKRYSSAWMLVWTFRGEKVCRMVEYHNTQAMAEAFTA